MSSFILIKFILKYTALHRKSYEVFLLLLSAPLHLPLALVSLSLAPSNSSCEPVVYSAEDPKLRNRRFLS